MAGLTMHTRPNIRCTGANWIYPWLVPILVSMALLGCDTADIPQDVARVMDQLPDQLDYNLHVKPILSDRCFACHGPDKNKQKANLRLDTPDGYSKTCESGRQAIVGGNLAKSDVFYRITASDPDLVMPTPQSHLTLSVEEKATLLKWIKQGAEWKEHWSLSKIQQPEVPEVKQTNWITNDIDRFVLHKLEENGLSLRPEADRSTLLRRVSLDLTGLPPTPAEQTAFLTDKSPKAYEKVVNRLLASAHYGEHLASNWLDLARFADTRGYQSDNYQHVSPYRDWVIRAFNQNLPFNDFVKWQLAGDLLPNPSREQRLATCFLRLHPQNTEVGIIPEEYRTEYVIDRVNTFGKAFLAHSVECARCHDHKYDPISQKDFYQLYAFFNNNREVGEVANSGEPSPSMVLTTPKAEDTLRQIRGYIAKLKPASLKPTPLTIQHVSPERGISLVQKGLDQSLLAYHPLDDTLGVARMAGRSLGKGVVKNLGTNALQFSSVNGRKGLLLQGDASVVYKNSLMLDRYQPFSLSLWLNVLDKQAKGILLGTVTNGMIDGYRGYCLELNADQTVSVILAHSYPANAIELKSKQKIPVNQWSHLILCYDGSSQANGVSLYLNGAKVPLQTLNNHLERSLLYTYGDNYLLKTQHAFRIGARIQATIKQVMVDEFRAYNRDLSWLEIQHLAGRQAGITSAFDPVHRKPDLDKAVADWYKRAFDPAYKAYQQQLFRLRAEENRILSTQEEVMVYQEQAKPRPTFILNRGVYDAPTTPVTADVPHKLPPLAQGLPKNRLGLAEWLLSSDNPLFARVTVNRYWQLIFGQGLVKTSDDFGNQGSLPSHPELLDWLASRFRQTNWNTKALLKEMVMSATYRQSSVPTPQALAQDPDNRLLSRYPANRMSAEMIRDNALAASGLLNPQIGGKSVKPYQPAGIWEALGNGNVINSRYVPDHGPALYRRSLYTFWKRNAPHPAMVNFDSPDRFSCLIRRQKTATPLQSLVTLNDPQFVEAARVLAQRGLEAGLTDEQLVDFFSQRIISRKARANEQQLLLELYRRAFLRFEKKPAKVKGLLEVGEFALNPKLPAPSLAAWTLVCSTMMNMDEALVKR